MNLSFSSQDNKDMVFKTIENVLKNKFNIINKDENRPWGGFFVIDEKQSEQFIKVFFSDLNRTAVITGNKLSPKILLVQPGKKLSWQYHFRRAELWKVIGGEVGVAKSETDKENEMETHTLGSLIKLRKGERHRLIGLSSWGIIAEIWQHTDANHPSDENDIVRLQDDYGR
jgi:mannose-6-phosphate isomerase-like protein (cupin superfamily)